MQNFKRKKKKKKEILKRREMFKKKERIQERRTKISKYEKRETKERVIRKKQTNKITLYNDNLKRNSKVGEKERLWSKINPMSIFIWRDFAKERNIKLHYTKEWKKEIQKGEQH